MKEEITSQKKNNYSKSENRFLKTEQMNFNKKQ